MVDNLRLGLMLGYWERPEANAEAFTRKAMERWLEKLRRNAYVKHF